MADIPKSTLVRTYLVGVIDTYGVLSGKQGAQAESYVDGDSVAAVTAWCDARCLRIVKPPVLKFEHYLS